MQIAYLIVLRYDKRLHNGNMPPEENSLHTVGGKKFIDTGRASFVFDNVKFQATRKCQ